MSADNFDQLAQANPDFKRLVWQAVLVRHWAPISTVSLQLNRLRMDIKGEHDARRISLRMHDYILAVLEGRVVPPNE